MRKNKRGSIILIVCLMAAAALLTACSLGQDGRRPESSAGTQGGDRVDTGFVLTGPESFDSADTPILVEKNKEDGTITFLNLDLGKRYTLSMDGTTHLYDKYGESVSLEQIQPGDIVDITFLKGSKHLTSMRLSPQAWKNEKIDRYEINPLRGEVTIGEMVYKLTKNTQYLSAGRTIEEMDLNAADVLSFQGIDSQVLSISVEKGHGYLRLENDENFVGGWIEIGQTQIRQITEDMLLVVPEGSYQVNISHKGGGGTKSVVINRNEETSLDIGDLEIPEPQKGTVIFSISPSSAALYIDGTEADASQPASLEYGIHQLIVKAEGYKSITQYIRVGQASAGVNIVLEPVKEGEEDQSGVSVSGGNVTDVSSTYYKVHVEAPEGVEVYLDGNYVGITPCSFKKVSGAHVLTLRKRGYETRSYTVQVDTEEKDISFSFAELVSTSKETTASTENVLNAQDLATEIINNVLGGR